MLLLDHVWDLSHSDSVIKLWLSRALFWGFGHQNFFDFQIPRDEKNRSFLPKDWRLPNFWMWNSVYFTNHKYVNISSFAVLNIKLWLEEDVYSNTDHPLYSLKFIQSRLKIDTQCCRLLAIILYIYSKHEKFCIFVISNNKSFLSPNLKAVGPLGGKFDLFIPWGCEIQSDFDYKTSKIKLYSVRASNAIWLRKIRHTAD